MLAKANGLNINVSRFHEIAVFNARWWGAKVDRDGPWPTFVPARQARKPKRQFCHRGGFGEWKTHRSVVEQDSDAVCIRWGILDLWHGVDHFLDFGTFYEFSGDLVVRILFGMSLDIACQIFSLGNLIWTTLRWLW
jgi:hypothetical protein